MYSFQPSSRSFVKQCTSGMWNALSLFRPVSSPRCSSLKLFENS